VRSGAVRHRGIGVPLVSSGLAASLNPALNVRLIPLFGIVIAAFASLAAVTLGEIASASPGEDGTRCRPSCLRSRAADHGRRRRLRRR